MRTVGKTFSRSATIADDFWSLPKLFAVTPLLGFAAFGAPVFCGANFHCFQIIIFFFFYAL